MSKECMDIEYMDMLFQLCNKMDNASCQTKRYEEVYKSVFYGKTEFIQEANTLINNYEGLING